MCSLLPLSRLCVCVCVLCFVVSLPCFPVPCALQAVGGFTQDQQDEVVDYLGDRLASNALANFHLLDVPVLLQRAVRIPCCFIFATHFLEKSNADVPRLAGRTASTG